MVQQSKRFTIAIIHRNGFDTLKSVLDSILADMTENDEVIIVDNNSTDNSIDKIEQDSVYRHVKIIKHTCNAGYGFSCNQSMIQGNGEYFLLCNNDIELPLGSLEAFENLFNSDKKAGLIGPQMFSLNGDKMRSYGTQSPNLLSQLDLIGRPIKNRDISSFSNVSILRGACLAVRREMVNDIGMYDEDFYFYHEETEWCYRINNSKWKVMFAPEIKISHVGGGSTSSVFASSRIEFFRSRLIFWKKIFPKYQLAILYTWNIPKLILDFIFYLIATIITLNLNIRLRKKLIDRAVVISWLILGRPDSWGLPNKCKQ